MHHSHEIEMGKLLSLSDDGILDEGNSNAYKGDEETKKPFNDMTKNYGSSTTCPTEIAHDLDSESPPVSMSLKSTPDTCSPPIESEESSTNSVEGYSAKMRKALGNRQRLLKLSIANSTFNSPLSRRTRNSDSGFSTVFTAAAHFSDHMLATESPLKLVEDDMTEKQPKIVDTEKDFEADLKMLSIPMLRKLPSPVPQDISMPTIEIDNKATPPQYMTPPDLWDIREKLRAKRMETGKDRNVVSLIDNLKALLCGTDTVDEYKKEQANTLLQKLSVALNTEGAQDEHCDTQQNNGDNTESITKVPQTIVRQGTFDMELKPTENENCEVTSGIHALVNEDISRMTHSLQSTQSLSPPKDIPEAMLKSSATYDSEPIAEREVLLLPHVENISPITSPQNTKSPVSLNEAATTNPDINDIIEQISKLFEQHQIATQTPNNDGTNSLKELTGSNASQTSTICNPTFIVVMPTNNIQSNMKQNVSSICGDFFADKNNDLSMRRRSQSLSLHDKIKIVQLPIRSKALVAGTDSSSLAANVMPQNSTATMEIKTPIRTQRRNSFSLGTPHTSLTSLQHGTGITNTRRLPNTAIHSRYSLGPSKTHERETQLHQAVVHPIPRAANLNAFKPDLKKRSKQQTAKTSVMTSKAPLKAVMPIKKVAPLLTATLATPERPLGNIRSQFHKASMETSMHLLTSSGKISNTSTPMSTARNSEQMSGAYSTPAVNISTNSARSSGTVTKWSSRFSNSTPTTKLQPNATSNNTLKKRALPELTKAKSPVRMRNSLAGVPPVQAVKSKQSIKVPNIPKQLETRLNIIKPNMRASFGGYSTSTNKENKKP
ncbi:uncharacterized protein [Eurosta solidaginis]